MSRLRDTKRRARRDLHLAMSVPAMYIASEGAEALQISVRLHTKFAALGEAPGAERNDIRPRILFLRSEVPLPRRGAIVSVEEGEAYQVGDALPADDITVTALVAPLSAEKTVGLPLPVDL